jgi:ketosteroid isomerase-like protein
MRQLKQLRETWNSDSFELISDFVDVGDRVAVRLIWGGVGGHGPESNIEATGVYTVRKGRILAIEFFWDHADALEALGCPADSRAAARACPAEGAVTRETSWGRSS